VVCDRFLTPSSVSPDGTCPKCGRPVERGLIPGMTRAADEPDPAVPWHLKLLALAFVIYLSWRVFQMIGWAFD
jgi:hypothetical protein